MPIRIFANSGENVDVELQKSYGFMNYSHLHTRYELYFCPQKLKQHIVVNSEEYYPEKPCAVLCAPYILHAMSSADPSQQEYYQICFYFNSKLFDTFADRYLPEKLKNSQVLFFEMEEEQAKDLRAITDLCIEKRTSLDIYEKELLLTLFLKRLCHICPDGKVHEVGKKGSYMQDVLRYISENFQNNINVDTVAEHFSVSRSKLNRDFRKYAASSFREFYDVCRLNEAKLLLLSHNRRSVSEVAHLSGFQNEAYFYTFFQKHTGLSPTEYQKKRGVKLEATNEKGIEIKNKSSRKGRQDIDG